MLFIFILLFIFVGFVGRCKNIEPFEPESVVLSTKSTDGVWFTRRIQPTVLDVETGSVDDADVHMVNQDLREYNEVKLTAGYSVYLFHSLYVRHEKYPGYGRAVLYRSTDSNHIRVTTPFTHFAIYQTSDEILSPTYDYDEEHRGDVHCNPLRLAAEKKVWPKDCLPEEFGDDCGFQGYGVKMGNYRGLPTECNQLVGDTLDADGVGVYSDPISTIYSNQSNPASRFPLDVPVFVSVFADSSLLSTTRAISNPETECEYVFKCKVHNQHELDSTINMLTSGTSGGVDDIRLQCEEHYVSAAC